MCVCVSAREREPKRDVYTREPACAPELSSCFARHKLPCHETNASMMQVWDMWRSLPLFARSPPDIRVADRQIKNALSGIATSLKICSRGTWLSKFSVWIGLGIAPVWFSAISSWWLRKMCPIILLFGVLW